MHMLRDKEYLIPNISHFYYLDLFLYSNKFIRYIEKKTPQSELRIKGYPLFNFFPIDATCLFLNS